VNGGTAGSGSRPPARRLVVLFAAMMLALAVVVVRLGVLQLRESGDLLALGAEQRIRTYEVSAERGMFLDRNGVPLAMTREARDIYANPELVSDPYGEARRIAPLLDLDQSWVRAALSADGTFVYLARQVDVEVAERVEVLHLPGIGSQVSNRRYYPAGSVGAQVLGFVGTDQTGLGGLEAYYEDVLTGTPGSRTVEVTPHGQEIAGGVLHEEPGVPGEDIVLTIDREMQYMAQRYLQHAVQENRAAGGTIVVMDPMTSEVLAMASYPTFDPNRFLDFDANNRINRAVTDAWEPGSVNTIDTAAAALETHSVGLSERFTVAPTRTIDGYTIHDAHWHPVESMTIGDIISESSNVGASLLADRAGNAALGQYFDRFGFGQRTGVGFPGEGVGIMPTGQWEDITRATVSFGAGVAVTPLQMASVYATIARGGVWEQPRLVASIIGADGAEREPSVEPARRVIEPETADLLTRMLAFVVEDGTGSAAQISGYQVAGKTGTAKKLGANGRYTNRYVASFIGFLPASAPRVVVAVVIDEPRTIYGGIAAAPLFSDMARYAIQRLGIEPAPAVADPPHVQAAT
jgi:cell division protein FtsI (penicillin-binding protein 3)